MQISRWAGRCRGPVFWPMEDASEVLRFYRDWIDGCPDELMTMIGCSISVRTTGRQARGGGGRVPDELLPAQSEHPAGLNHSFEGGAKSSSWMLSGSRNTRTDA
jgi:hypothetical protein